MKFNYLKKLGLAGLLAVSAGLPLAANAAQGLYPLTLTINLALTDPIFKDEIEIGGKVVKFTLNNTRLIYASLGFSPDLGDLTGEDRADAIADAKTRRLFALLDPADDSEDGFCEIDLVVADVDGNNANGFGQLLLCVDDTETFSEANFDKVGNIAVGFTAGLRIEVGDESFALFTGADVVDTGGLDPETVEIPRRILMKGSAVVKKTCEEMVECDEETLTFTATSLSGTGMVGELKGDDGEEFTTQVIGGSFKIDLKKAPLFPPV